MSSSCTFELSTDEGCEWVCGSVAGCLWQLADHLPAGAEGAFLFEKLSVLSQTEQERVTEPEDRGTEALEEALYHSNSIRQQTIRTKGAAWAPRAGHRLLARRSEVPLGSFDPRFFFPFCLDSPATPSIMQATASEATRLWLLGGIGVDPFANTSAPHSQPLHGPISSFDVLDTCSATCDEAKQGSGLGCSEC